MAACLLVVLICMFWPRARDEAVYWYICQYLSHESSVLPQSAAVSGSSSSLFEVPKSDVCLPIRLDDTEDIFKALWPLSDHVRLQPPILHTTVGGKPSLILITRPKDDKTAKPKVTQLVFEGVVHVHGGEILLGKLVP